MINQFKTFFDFTLDIKAYFRSIGQSTKLITFANCIVRYPIKMNESERLLTLEKYQILDSLPEKEFDEVVDLASAMFDAPISFISLIESERQWFKSIKGLDASEAERKYSFCNYTIRNPGEVMVVNDATKDERFRTNPYVTDDPHIRFYAGTTLTTEENLALGTLCVIDIKPREFSEEQQRVLKVLAKKIMNLLELRKENFLHKRELGIAKEELKLTLDRLIEAQQTAQIGSWDWNLETNELYWSEEMYKIYGIKERGDENQLEEWLKLVHADDKDLVKRTLTDGIKEGKQGVIEYRIKRPDGREMWVETRGRVTFGTEKIERITGTVQDITGRKRADIERTRYAKTLEDMMFDLSHKIRQPLTNCLGLIPVLDSEKLSHEQVKEFVQFLKVSVEKIDQYTRDMSDYIHRSTKQLED